MPLYAISCIDHPDSLDLRMAARPAHLAFIEENRAMVKLAGPYLDEAGDMVGSMFIIEAPDRATVDAFAAADPYAKAGLFHHTHIRPWRIAVGGFS